jgi:hypothetical protein
MQAAASTALTIPGDGNGVDGGADCGRRRVPETKPR